MIILDATTKKLQFKYQTSHSCEIIVCYVDITSTTSTPGTQVTQISSSTTATDICAAPAASTQRQIKSIHIVGDTTSTAIAEAFVYLDNNGTDTVLWHGYFCDPASTSEYGTVDSICVTYHSGAGWEYSTGKGAKYRTIGFLPWADPHMRGIQDDDTTTNLTVSTNGQLCAVYVGVAQRFTTSVKVYCNVTTAAATITYSEVGVYTAPSLSPSANGLAAISSPNTSLSLRYKGFADTSAVFNSTGEKEVTVTLVEPIFPGEIVYVGTSTDATTDPAFAAALVDNLGTGQQVFSDSSRPSTAGAEVVVRNIANAASHPIMHAILN